MNLRTLTVVAAVWLTGAATWAAYPSEADHSIWIEIDSAPSGARLDTWPDEPSGISKQVDVTPCTIVAELNWGKGFLGKKWSKLKIQSPGNICEAILSSNNAYEIYIKALVSREGCETRRLRAKVLTLPPPGFFWGGKSAWPVRWDVTIPLKPAPAGAPAAAPAPAPVVIVAKKAGTEPTAGGTGNLLVQCNVAEAEVMVDGELVGRTPLNLVLQAGPHAIELRKPGYAPFKTEFETEANAQLKMEAALDPL